MAKVLALVADGTEEVELLSVVNILRRAGVDVTIASIYERTNVITSHNIKMIADDSVTNINLTGYDLIFIPGGMPGVTNILGCEGILDALREQIRLKKRVAAICAGPSILGRAGILEGIKATCYPGFENELTGATYSPSGIVTDGLISTSRGVGVAIDFGLELASLLCGIEKAEEIKKSIIHPDTI